MMTEHSAPGPAEGTALTPQGLRACLGRFTTGVTVVSYAADGERRGATVNSFTSVSLDPPLVLVSLARTTRASQHVSSGAFAVNVLGSDQVDVALQFAGKTRPGARIRWRETSGRRPAPELEGAIAVFQCRPWRCYDGGDHVMHLGEVLSAEQQPGEPLLFSGGRFAMTGLPLFDGPRVVDADDPASTRWLGHACKLHDSASVA